MKSAWRMRKASCTWPASKLFKFPDSERVLVRSEVHAASTKFDALHLQTEALFQGGRKAKFDLTTSPDHPLPWKRPGIGSQKPRDRSMIERVSGCGGHLAVGCYFTLRDGADHSPESGVAKIIRPRAVFRDPANQFS